MDGGKNKHSQALQRSAYLRSPQIVVNDDDICRGKGREGRGRRGLERRGGAEDAKSGRKWKFPRPICREVKYAGRIPLSPPHRVPCRLGLGGRGKA